MADERKPEPRIRDATVLPDARRPLPSLRPPFCRLPLAGLRTPPKGPPPAVFCNRQFSRPPGGALLAGQRVPTVAAPPPAGGAGPRFGCAGRAQVAFGFSRPAGPACPQTRNTTGAPSCPGAEPIRAGGFAPGPMATDRSGCIWAAPEQR